MQTFGIFYLLLYSIVVQGTTSLKLTIDPVHAHSRPGENITITCSADVPITNCQFRIDNNPIMDLSKGIHSNPDQRFAYVGAGLENGGCAILLTNNAFTPYKQTIYLISCRVRSNSSIWEYKDMTLIHKNKIGIEVEHFPQREVLVVPGATVQLSVQAQNMLTFCVYVLSKSYTSIDESTRFTYNLNKTLAENKRGQIMPYYGRGLDNGTCGLQFQNELSFNKYIGAFIDVRTDNSNEETIFFHLIFTEFPSKPLLQVLSNGFSNDSVLHATCVIERSRPKAIIIWMLGNVAITDGICEEDINDDWSFPTSFKATKQRLVRVLSRDDHSKSLVCIAENVALPQARATSDPYVVDVKYDENTKHPVLNKTEAPTTYFVPFIACGVLLIISAIMMTMMTIYCCVRPCRSFSYRHSQPDNILVSPPIRKPDTSAYVRQCEIKCRKKNEPSENDSDYVNWHLGSTKENVATPEYLELY